MLSFKEEIWWAICQSDLTSLLTTINLMSLAPPLPNPFLCKSISLVPLHAEHLDFSGLGLKLENWSTVSPETPAFHTTKWKNLSDHKEHIAIKGHLLLVCCTQSPTGPFTLPPNTYDATAKKKYKVSTRAVNRIWYQYRETAVCTEKQHSRTRTMDWVMLEIRGCTTVVVVGRESYCAWLFGGDEETSSKEVQEVSEKTLNCYMCETINHL